MRAVSGLLAESESTYELGFYKKNQEMQIYRLKLRLAGDSMINHCDPHASPRSCEGPGGGAALHLDEVEDGPGRVRGVRQHLVRIPRG